MTTQKKPKKQNKEYIPYSDWSKNAIESIDKLTDECLDRFYEDRKLNEELLKMLAKLKTLVEDKYKK
jgi:hypothetical protein